MSTEPDDDVLVLLTEHERLVLQDAGFELHHGPRRNAWEKEWLGPLWAQRLVRALWLYTARSAVVAVLRTAREDPEMRAALEASARLAGLQGVRSAVDVVRIA